MSDSSFDSASNSAPDSAPDSASDSASEAHLPRVESAGRQPTARIGRARLKLTANPHDRDVPPSSLSVAVQKGLVYLFLIGLVIVAVLLLMDRWRRGSLALSGTLIYLGLIRWVVDSRIMGVLAVRSRKFDSWFTIIIGLLIGFLASSVDPLI